MRISLPLVALTLLIALFVAVVSGRPSAGGEGQSAFVIGIEDMPLMAGLIEDEEAGLIFDKPGGRLIEAYAFGRLGADEVSEFYRTTLPALGWRHVDNLAFLREGEMLRIHLIAGEDGLTVRFVLSPQ
jgi:hypothetical protein